MEQVRLRDFTVSRARPSSRRAVSFPSTPSNLSRRSAISPTSILQLAHPTHHSSGEASAESEASRTSILSVSRRASSSKPPPHAA